MPLPSRRSAKSLPVLSVTKNAACIARSSRRRTWLTPRPQAVLLPPHRPAQDPHRPACLRSPALPLHRPQTPLSQAKGAARMALLASVPTAVKSATSKPTESQYLPPNSSARVRFRISDLKKRRSHELVGREKPAVLTRLTCVALFGLLAKKLFLLARHSQWGAWTCDWNFNIQSHCSGTCHRSVKQHVHAFTATQPMRRTCFQYRQKLQSAYFSSCGRACSCFNTTNSLFTPQVSYPRAALLPHNHRRPKETFMLTSTISTGCAPCSTVLGSRRTGPMVRATALSGPCLLL